MITSLQIMDWKSVDHAQLSIDPLTVLIGTNSSGKSNVLDAFGFLSRSATGMMLTSALQGDGLAPPLRGGVEWAARKPGDTFSLSVTYRQDASTDLIYAIDCVTDASRCELTAESLDRVRYRLGKDGKRKSSSVIGLFRTDIAEESSPTIVARLYNGKRGTPRQVGRGNSALFQLYSQKTPVEVQDGIERIVAALRNIFILDPIPSHMRRFSPLSDRLDPDAGNIAGVLAALEGRHKKDIEDILTRYTRRLPERDIEKVFAEPVGKFFNDAMLYCEEHLGRLGEPHTVDARGMSDGTLRFLAILTALLTRPANSLLVIEEVDNGLHPSRSQLLLDMLREQGAVRRVDVVVTTHNPALLDAMGSKMVPFITVAHRDVETGASRLTLLEDIEDLPKLLAEGPVGRVSSRGLIEEALSAEAS